MTRPSAFFRFDPVRHVRGKATGDLIELELKNRIGVIETDGTRNKDKPVRRVCMDKVHALSGIKPLYRRSNHNAIGANLVDRYFAVGPVGR